MSYRMCVGHIYALQDHMFGHSRAEPHAALSTKCARPTYVSQRLAKPSNLGIQCPHIATAQWPQLICSKASRHLLRVSQLVLKCEWSLLRIALVETE